MPDPRSAAIVVVNYSSNHFAGWKRSTVRRGIYPQTGIANGHQFVLGRTFGDVQVVDVRCSLAGGHGMRCDLDEARPSPFALGALPADPLAFFGLPTIGGVPLQVVRIEPDGAFYRVLWRARAGRMLCAYVWTLWSPDQPGIAHGELVTVASNPAVLDMGEAVPANFDLRFGDSLVAIAGAGVGGPAIAPGTWLADGQGKAMPFLVVWPRHLQSAVEWSSAGALADLGIAGVGLDRIWWNGNATLPANFSARAWGDDRFWAAARGLHTWDAPVCGPAPVSSSAGDQEDQLYHPGAEALRFDGVGCEIVTLLAALKLHAERPCNHLEADGTPLNPDRHPGLLFWDGRPHQRNSHDMLGKPRELDRAEAHERWGPDVQHLYTGRLTAAARLTGSCAAQWLLERLCTVYLLQRTTTPGWGQSVFESGRELGLEGLFLVRTLPTLEDRGLAARVETRFRARVASIILPNLTGADYCRVFTDDPRLGTGDWVISWQECLAADGMDQAGEYLNLPALRQVALRIARWQLEHCWAQDGTAWVSAPVRPVATGTDAAPDMAVARAYVHEDCGIRLPATDAPPLFDSSFNGYGMPGCVAVVLRHEPGNVKARAIWAQLQRECTGGGRWLSPGVPSA